MFNFRVAIQKHQKETKIVKKNNFILQLFNDKNLKLASLKSYKIR